MKALSDLLLIVAAVISAAWLISNPTYEPAIAFLVAIGAVLTRAIAAFQSRDTSLLLGRLMLPVFRWKDRRTPKAELEFDSLCGSKAIHHSLKAWSIWDSDGPTTWIELRHKQDGGSWTTMWRFEGHTIKLSSRDVDGDGHPEVVVLYACGAHSRAVKMFMVGRNGFLVAIPGSEIGSDWPEILLDDKDGDGKVEIYAKQRDWSKVPTQDPVTKVYVFRDGAFEPRRNA